MDESKILELIDEQFKLMKDEVHADIHSSFTYQDGYDYDYNELQDEIRNTLDYHCDKLRDKIKGIS